MDSNLKYNIQRWDAARYLFLEKIGGLYVDFDYECISPFDELLKDKSCCFAEEPDHLGINVNKKDNINNGLIACSPGNAFLKTAIQYIFEKIDMNQIFPNKIMEVLNTTGPMMLTKLYNEYDKKEDVYTVIPVLL